MQVDSSTYSSQCVVPGDIVGNTRTSSGGKGTYTLESEIRASLVGVIEKSANADGNGEVIEVHLIGKEVQVVPKIGNEVTVRITKATPKSANAEILCIGTKALKESYKGTIRPGDIVKAEVVSLGDERSFFLSTARNDLGVIFAQSVAGEPMIPISWHEMVCPKTGQREQRKVAKIYS